MKEFKGTKGELELKFVSGICIGIGTVGDYSTITANTILPDTDKEYEQSKEQILSNMKLYAAAPELLVALQEMVELWSNLSTAIKPLVNEEAYVKALAAINKAL